MISSLAPLRVVFPFFLPFFAFLFSSRLTRVCPTHIDSAVHSELDALSTIRQATSIDHFATQCTPRARRGDANT